MSPKSKTQKFMFGKHPGIEKKFAKETPNMGKLKTRKKRVKNNSIMLGKA